MPVEPDPQYAPEIAQFGEAANQAASIKYDVPLPGAHSFQSVTPLVLVPTDWFNEVWARAQGAELSELGVLEGSTLDENKLLALYQRMLPPTARPSPRVAAEVGVGVIEPASGNGVAVRSAEPNVRATLAAMREDGRSVLDQGSIEIQRLRRQEFLEGLAKRQVSDLPPSSTMPIQVPVPALGQSVQTVDYNVMGPNPPRIAIVETWQITSFLGDYGLGRTLQTFSLLPGERTTITVESWRTDATTREDASSVFDSSDTEAQSRYSSTLMMESGSAFQDQGGWALSVGTKAGLDLGVVKGSVEVDFSANHQEARQQFSNNTAQANQEHAQQCNANRRQTIEETSTTTTETGVSQTTVREISNTNLRRVLNFVFRELNQKYLTITSLRDVRIAFYNGKVGSAQIVPLADLRRLLEDIIQDARKEELARIILKMVAKCVDHTGTPQTMLEVGTLDPDNPGTYLWADAPLRLADNGDVEIAFEDNPLAPQYSWRIKRGPIAQDGVAHPPVPGIVTAMDEIVLRTDNIVVEALLGQADALDTYATALQEVDIESRKADIESRKADIEEREAETRRTNDALDLVKAQKEAPDIPTAVDTFERFFSDIRFVGEKPDIEVNPDIEVAVGNDGGNQ